MQNGSGDQIQFLTLISLTVWSQLLLLQRSSSLALKRNDYIGWSLGPLTFLKAYTFMYWLKFKFNSVAQLCPTLWPMDDSMPGLNNYIQSLKGIYWSLNRYFVDFADILSESGKNHSTQYIIKILMLCIPSSQLSH